MTKPFNPDLPCTTRDGRPVRILCTDAPGPYPIVGYVNFIEEIRIVGVTWNREGKSAASFERDLDIINVPTKCKGWIGVEPALRGERIALVSNVFLSEVQVRKSTGNSFAQYIEIEFDE